MSLLLKDYCFRNTTLFLFDNFLKSDRIVVIMIKKKKITYISEEEEKPENRLKNLKKQLIECKREKEENLTQAQRARADLINYRRRQEDALPEFIAMGQVNIIQRILPVLDSLEAGAEKNEDIKQIKEQMISALKECNIEEIKAMGEKFNPEYHEALDQVESEEESGIIIEQIQKGYLLNKKALRPSKVRVAK